MKAIKGILRVIGGAFSALMALGGIFAAVQERQPGLLILAAVFAVPAYFLLRTKKAKGGPSQGPAPAQASSYAPDVPEETLREMRKYYGAEQAQNDVRIMQESLQLIQQTTNFDTFLSRLDLLQRTALTLLQAEKAGCRGLPPGARGACEKALEASKSAKVNFLYNSYIKETNDALRLKTPAGKRKRLEAYLSKLRAHEADFMDVEDAYKKAIYDTETLL